LLFGCKQVSGFPEGHVPQTPSTRTRMEPNNRKRIPSLHEGCILEFHPVVEVEIMCSRRVKTKIDNRIEPLTYNFFCLSCHETDGKVSCAFDLWMLSSRFDVFSDTTGRFSFGELPLFNLVSIFIVVRSSFCPFHTIACILSDGTAFSLFSFNFSRPMTLGM
jgi:hypothetical protein